LPDRGLVPFGNQAFNHPFNRSGSHPFNHPVAPPFAHPRLKTASDLR
jgi:hypothetical protein